MQSITVSRPRVQIYLNIIQPGVPVLSPKITTDKADTFVVGKISRRTYRRAFSNALTKRRGRGGAEGGESREEVCEQNNSGA